MQQDGTWRTFLAGTVTLLATSALAVAFGDSVNAGLGVFVPAAIFLAALAQIGTAACIAYLYVRAPQRAAAHLAGTFAMAGIISLLQAVVVPFGAFEGGVLRLGAQASMWTHVVWIATFAANALVYVHLGAQPHPLPRRPRAYLRRRIGTMTALAFGICLALVLLVGKLPWLAQGMQFNLPARAAFGTFLFGLCLLGTILLMVLGSRARLERALSLMMLATALDAGLTLLSAHRFTAAWYAAWLIDFGVSAWMFAGALRAVVELRLSPQAGAGQHDRQTQRLETLWRLAGSAFRDDGAFLRALIDEGARTLRSDLHLHGVIAHVEDTELVIDVAFPSVVGSDTIAPGQRFPLRTSVLGEVLRRGRTTSWQDIREDPVFDRIPRVRALLWRAVIATRFDVGPVPYLICFLCVRPAAVPFGADDEAYVETLSSLCGARLQQRAQLERLRYQNDHDALTGTLNRSSFRARGFAALREHGRIAVVVADLDYFREINDTLGHQTGDAVLTEVAATFTRAAQNGETLARLGGDSFAILFYDSGGRREVERAVARYAAALSVPLAIGEPDDPQFVNVNASFGIALSPADGTDFEDLLARAEIAVYAAKESGRGRWAFFDPRKQEVSIQSHRLQHELLEAIARDELVLYFQPHIELTSGRVAGAEALIRWNHPERGLLAPSEFIPFAERHGLVSRIGDWVMRETLRSSRRWREADPAFRVWFNLSAAELTDPHLLTRFQEIDDGLDGIGVEVTETAAMGDVAATRLAIQGLHRCGVMIALDDFGTGYSSLAQLKRLEVDVVKIDRAFTAGVPRDSHDVAIYEAVISIARHYGFETIAEGVEDLAQVAFLAGIGCTHGQGFVYAHPMPAPAFDVWFTERTAPPRGGRLGLEPRLSAASG